MPNAERRHPFSEVAIPMAFPPREIGRTGIFVTPLAMGCWPIAGITSIDVTVEQSEATLAAAFDAGINFFDTAYCYGYDGESERMIARILGPRRREIVIATKGGIVWGADKKQIRDGRPESIRRHCEESLRRLKTDCVELYYLHAPDPSIPVAESATAFRDLIDSGKIRAAGLSNATTDQLREFHAVCPLAAYQPHYNMLQREIESDQLPWCVERNVSVMVYWPLMKGLLAGKLPRDHQFDPKDGRRKYPMFHGEEWRRNHDFLDGLRLIAAEIGTSVAQLVLNWTIQRPGISVALCGAKRPDQIRDNAGAMTWRITEQQMVRINQLIAQRGESASRGAV
jgi:aryl-alcohol dehydrogenase-like predicted oxidoreductase